MTPALALGTLHIASFRGLRGVELLSPGRFNLLVGPNSSGKTSVLEALAFFCRPADPVHWWQLGGSRSRFWLEKPSLLEVMLAPLERRGGSVLPAWVAAEDAGHRVQRATVSAEVHEVITQQSSALQRQASIRWAAEVSGGEQPVVSASVTLKAGQTELVLPPTARPDSAPQLPVELVDTLTHRSDEGYPRGWSALVNRQEQDAVLAMLRPLEPGLATLSLHVSDDNARRPELVAHHVKGRCSLSMFGDGLKRALTYALAVARARGGVLLIDEVETALHVSALGRVYGWLREVCEAWNVQVFATTHSLEAVDALLGPKAQTEDTVCFQLGEEGRVVKRFQGDLLWRIVKRRGLDVR